MAKKSNKRSSSYSSKKAKPRKVSRPQPKRHVKTTRYTPAKKPIKRKPVKQPAKRVNYKNEYVKLLEKNLRKLNRDVSAIKKTISKPGAQVKQPIIPKGKGPASKEAFPLEEDYVISDLPKDQQEALEMLTELQRQMNQRNIMLDEMMSAEGKLF